jgi:cbb3-type cytochrome oxidase maturation protein
MSIIGLLLPLALLLGLIFLGGFIWMSASGQYEDLDTPAYRLLLEENSIHRKEKVEP